MNNIEVTIILSLDFIHLLICHFKPDEKLLSEYLHLRNILLLTAVGIFGGDDHMCTWAARVISISLMSTCVIHGLM